MKKFYLSVLLILFLFCIFSCDNGSGSTAVSDRSASVCVSLGISMNGANRTISSTGGVQNLSEISYYTYTAEPKFNGTDFTVPQGTQLTPARFSPGDSILFAQGRWFITVNAYSEDDMLLCQGSDTVYINANISTVSIPVSKISGNGALDLTIRVPQISNREGSDNFIIDYRLFGGETNTQINYSRSYEDGWIIYTSHIADMPAGSYVISCLFGDGDVNISYGEAAVAEIFANMTTTLDGVLPVGVLMSRGISPTVYRQPGERVAFVCTDTAENYVWYVNGVQKQTGSGSVFIYTPTANGTENIECRLEDSTENKATATLIVRSPIVITMHFADDTELVYNTYVGATRPADLVEYLPSNYDGKWYTAPENGSGGGGSQVSADAFTANTTIYGHRNYCTVTFNKGSNTGNVTINPATIRGYQGDPLGTLPTATTTATFVLKGWFTAQSGGTYVTADTAIPGNVTYYAQWLNFHDLSNNTPEAFDDFLVAYATYDPNDGAAHVVSPPLWGLLWLGGYDRVNPGETTSVPGNNNLYSPSGYPNRDGWYRNCDIIKDGGGNVTEVNFYNKWDFNTGVTENMVLYANPYRNNNTDRRTVTFNSNGGSAVASITNVIRYNTIAKPADPTRDGYTFMGWYTDNGTFSNKWNFETKGVQTNMTLYAMWAKNKNYIENTSTSGAYIDTGVVPTRNTRMEIQFNYEGDDTYSTGLIGISNPAFSISTNRTTRLFEAKYKDDVIGAAGVYFNSGVHTLEFSVGGGFIIDSVMMVSDELTSASLGAEDTICVFKTNGSSVTSVGKCYYVKIYEGGVLIRDMIPVVVNDVAGMYDRVEGGFYPSMSSTPFGTN